MPPVYPQLHETLQQILLRELGWDTLRPVQEETYLAAGTGDDLLVIAPTAGGKTEAALIPVIDRILKEGLPGVCCLYISPLKALINDQEERFHRLCTPAGLEVMKWHGDVPRGHRGWRRGRRPEEGDPPHILMITPESLEVLLLERNLVPDLENLRFVVIDEAHALVESLRGVQLQAILGRLDRQQGRHIPRIGLSATVGNPEDVLSWIAAGHALRRLVRIPVPPRKKKFTFLVRKEPEARMGAIARAVSGKKALVFVNSRSSAEEVAQALLGRVHRCAVHHSSLSPALRRAAEEAFAGEGSACIICTSTLELGIDIGDLDLVVQLGPPPSVSSFLQRMGRAGRRGSAPHVVSILADPAELLVTLAVIEAAGRHEVEPLRPPALPYTVLVQQIFLMLLKVGRVSRRILKEDLSSLAPFRALPRDAVTRVIDHLLAGEFLIADGDLLMPGPRAEQTLGRSNWKDLFSVIAGAGEVRAVTPEGEIVGRLDERFVRAGGGGRGVFSLGGHDWRVVARDESHGRVVVVPGSGDRSTVFWTGGTSGISPLVCQAIRQIVSRGQTELPIGYRETAMLEEALQAFPAPFPAEGVVIREVAGSRATAVQVLTFAGRQTNRVLAAGIRARIPGKVRTRYDDLAVIVDGGRAGPGPWPVASVVESLRTLPQPGDIPLPDLPRNAWKFGTFLPEREFAAMTSADYYDWDGVARGLCGVPVTTLARDPGDG